MVIVDDDFKLVQESHNLLQYPAGMTEGRPGPVYFHLGLSS